MIIISTCAPSAAARPTTLSCGLAAWRLPEDFLVAACSLHLAYTDFSHSIIPHLPFTSSTFEHSLIFEHIIHPYHPDSFDSLLLKHGLSCDYSPLPLNLRCGFPLVHMPTLTETMILPNNPLTYPYMDEIHYYLHKELLAGRMSGPFSCEETELILHGAFQSSPLIICIQPQQHGMPNKLRICRHLSEASFHQLIHLKRRLPNVIWLGLHLQLSLWWNKESSQEWIPELCHQYLVPHNACPCLWT